MSQAGPQINGPASPTGKFIDTIDPDDPEYRRNLQRPAEVKEDMKQMEGRSRVSVVLNSQAFREELEQIIAEQIAQGGPASLFALQQISDLLLPQSRAGYSLSTASPGIPVNDIRGVDAYGHTKAEKILRCKLAACYRLVDLFGWTHGIYNHISARLSQEQEQFLVNPFGMLYSEITASTLIKVNMQGEVLDTGSTGLGISKAGFTLHSAIHQARPDIRCVIHLHTPAAVAVSATKRGLIPLSQEALICGQVSYHDYRGILVDQEERDQLARNLGPFNKVMLLRNHGVVACGETIEEAFHYAFNIMAACETQVRAMSAGIENLILVDEETQKRTFTVGSQGGGGTDISGRKWRCGELEWEALMRTLDNAGYRTGHVYKQPLMKQEKKERTNSDVEVPPASSSFTYIFDGDYEHSKYISPVKTALERQKQAYKAGWLTSPNTYKKQEIEEIGTTTPKRITKWVTDGEGGQQKGMTVKIENPNQFAPQGANPKEFKEKQKQIKKDYYEEKVTPGPQSKILEGISWDEAARMKEAGDQTIVIGAASKGIIQRDHQHNAVVYRSYYSANPFESMSEAEMDAYKQEVERREQGDEPEDIPGPEGRLISTEERMQQIQRSREDVDKQDTEDEERETKIGSVVNGEPQVEAQVKPQVKPQVKLQVEPQVEPPVKPLIEAELKPERIQEVTSPPRAAESRQISSATMASHESSVALKPSPLTLTPLKHEEGLSQLADSVAQAVTASAFASSCSKGQHGVVGDGRVVGSSPSQLLSGHSSPLADAATASKHFDLPNQPAGQSQHWEATPHGKLGAKIVDGDGRDQKEPGSVVVELKPVRLFQGKPGEGVMKIRFTIHSKVTRRKAIGSKASWPVEHASILLSQPEVIFTNPEQSKPQNPSFPQKQQHAEAAKAPNGWQQSSANIPNTTLLQKASPKHPVHPHGWRTGSFRPYKSHRKSKRLRVRKVVHGPLSPVNEEVPGEETLEALLACQNVDTDTDISLEELLLSPENFFQNTSEANKTFQYGQSGQRNSEKQQAVEPTSASTHEPLFIMPKVGVPQQVFDIPVRNVHSVSPSLADLQIESNKTISSHLVRPQLTEEFLVTSVGTNESQEKKPAANHGVPTKPFLDFVSEPSLVAAPLAEEEDLEYADASSPTTSPFQKEKPVFYNQNIPDQPALEIVPASPLPAIPLGEEEIGYADASSPTPFHTNSLSLQNEEKAVLHTPDSVQNISISSNVEEKSAHIDLQRVPSSDSPPDETGADVSRKQAIMQRVMRIGHRLPIVWQQAESTQGNRNVAAMNAVLGTVTTNQVEATSGRHLHAECLTPAGGDGLVSDQQAKKQQTQGGTESAENLDLHTHSQEDSAAVCFSGDSIHPCTLEDSTTTSAHTFQKTCEEDVAKYYKDIAIFEDGGVITRTPISFSAIPPKMKSDLVVDEGPLQTSSPKLGRRQDSDSFKRYQSKMGKSEETLKAVVPLEQPDPLADSRRSRPRRSKSFPRNLGSVRSRDAMLDDSPLRVGNLDLIRSQNATLDNSPLQGANEEEKPGTGNVPVPALSVGQDLQLKKHHVRGASVSGPIIGSQQSIQKNKSLETFVDNPPAKVEGVCERTLSWSEASLRLKEENQLTTEVPGSHFQTEAWHSTDDRDEKESPRRCHRRMQGAEVREVSETRGAEENNMDEKEIPEHYWSGKKRRRRRQPPPEELPRISGGQLDAVDAEELLRVSGGQADAVDSSSVPEAVQAKEDSSDSEEAGTQQKVTSAVKDTDSQLIKLDTVEEIGHITLHHLEDVDSQKRPEETEWAEMTTIKIAGEGVTYVRSSKQAASVKMESGNVISSASDDLPTPPEVPDDDLYIEGDTDEFPAPPADLQVFGPTDAVEKEVKEDVAGPTDAIKTKEHEMEVGSMPEVAKHEHEETEDGTPPAYDTTLFSDLLAEEYNDEPFRIRRRMPAKDIKGKDEEPVYAKVLPRSERLSSASMGSSSIPVKVKAGLSDHRHLPSEPGNPAKFSVGELNAVDYEEDAPRLRRRRRGRQSQEALTKVDDDDSSFKRAVFRPLSEGWNRGARGDSYEEISSDAPRVRRWKHKEAATFRYSEPPPMISFPSGYPSGKSSKNNSSATLPTEIMPHHRQLGRKAVSQEILSLQPTLLYQEEPPGVTRELPGKKKILKTVLSCVNAQENDRTLKKSSKEYSSPPLIKVDSVESRRKRGSGMFPSTAENSSSHREGSFDSSSETKSATEKYFKDEEEISGNYEDAEDDAGTFNHHKLYVVDKLQEGRTKKREHGGKKQNDSCLGEAVQDHSFTRAQTPQHSPRSIRRQTGDDHEETGPCTRRSVSFTDGYTPTMSHLPIGMHTGESLTNERFILSEPSTSVKRSESDRRPEKNPALIRELESRGIGRSKSDRRPRGKFRKQQEKTRLRRISLARHQSPTLWTVLAVGRRWKNIAAKRDRPQRKCHRLPRTRRRRRNSACPPSPRRRRTARRAPSELGWLLPLPSLATRLSRAWPADMVILLRHLHAPLSSCASVDFFSCLAHGSTFHFFYISECLAHSR